MRIVLAPMEGLADVYLRRLLTRQGGFDWAVSEFVRVVDRPYPDRVFYNHCPELRQNGRTDSGTPIRVQLLGSDLDAMAENAQIAARLGSHGIDLNFGCPSKTVNKRNGGAVLLQNPNTLFEVVKAVRSSLPEDIVVSAKMRLGYEDNSLMLENALAVEEAGATELTVHARTKVQGYKPPAHWQDLSIIREHIRIPLIANGDIWSVEDYRLCREVSGATDVMIGRGAVRNPQLAMQIRLDDSSATDESIHRLITEFWNDIQQSLPERDCAGRLKQWVNHLRQSHPLAEVLWHEIRTEKNATALERMIQNAA